MNPHHLMKKLVSLSNVVGKGCRLAWPPLLLIGLCLACRTQLRTEGRLGTSESRFTEDNICVAIDQIRSREETVKSMRATFTEEGVLAAQKLAGCAYDDSAYRRNLKEVERILDLRRRQLDAELRVYFDFLRTDPIPFKKEAY